MNTKKIILDQSPPTASIRVLAIASAGGHWHELMRLRPALEDFDVHYASVDEALAQSVSPRPFYVVPDTHFDNPLKILRTFLKALQVIRQMRPAAVISTGSAPGGLAILAARWFGARTVWVESAANCTEQSRSGRFVRRVAGTVLVQWPELERPGGPYYRGNILL